MLISNLKTLTLYLRTIIVNNVCVIQFLEFSGGRWIDDMYMHVHQRFQTKCLQKHARRVTLKDLWIIYELLL